jgi:serine/threonine protein kinase
MNWMAPEVLERPYDERSDVWSLGCIMLDASTCGILDQAQTMAVSLAQTCGVPSRALTQPSHAPPAIVYPCAGAV